MVEHILGKDEVEGPIPSCGTISDTMAFMMRKGVDPLSIEKACVLLRAGKIVAIPTETVYGMAVDATNDTAIATLYATKDRPTFNPLILHVHSFEQAQEYGVFSPEAARLAKHFWCPGTTRHRPLTLVVPTRAPSPISKLATAGLQTVGIRAPDHPLTHALLKAYPNPLAAPSANRSTHVSATDAARVRVEFGEEIPLVLDGGVCRIGVESTILDFSDPTACATLLRPGGATLEELEKILGYTPAPAPISEVIKAPGMMKRHYAPSIPLRRNCTEPCDGAAYLGFGEYSFGPYNLSPSGDLLEAAANLFRMLIQLDNPNTFSRIDVAPIPERGLGLAINDRLSRAETTS